MAHRRPLPVDPIAEAKRQWVEHGWSDAAVGMSAVASVMRAQQLMLSRTEAVLRPFRLSFARFELLRLLAFSREGRMPMGSVGARLQVHPASVTSTVQRLERDGLVTRAPHPRDGRSMLLELTEAGRATIEAATAALNAEAFADVGLSEDDTAELVRILARLRKDAGDFGDPPAAPASLL